MAGRVTASCSYQANFQVTGVSHIENFETAGEQGNCHMTAHPNWDSTLSWRKSSASSEGGECVEVAQDDSSVLVRDSHNRSGTVLAFSCAQWLEVVRGIKNGKMSRP